MKNTNKFYAALITMTFGFSLISNVGAGDIDLFLSDITLSTLFQIN